MKKGILISLLALSLAACGGGSGGSSNDNTDQPETTSASEITIDSYSSDAASSTSPVGTWIAVYSGTHFTDNTQDWTYKGRELFTIKEEGDTYNIISCHGSIQTSSINKTDFLITQTAGYTYPYYTEEYTQTFTSNTEFTRTSTNTEVVTGEGSEQDSVEKWIQTTAAIKINDSTNIKENISITSQNDEFAADNIEIGCAGLYETSQGLSIFNTENEDLAIVLENDLAKQEHFIYFSKNGISFESDVTDTGVNISYDVTNNAVDNYAVTANHSSPTHSGTFNVSVDFK